MVIEAEGKNKLIEKIVIGILDVKGHDIKMIDLRKIENRICDYYVICSGNSNTHVSAILESVKKKVSKTMKEKPSHTEGEENAEWILLDYINVVVHIFQKHVRDFYRIEELWGDCKTNLIPIKNN
jgi:ribosome-associated protein